MVAVNTTAPPKAAEAAATATVTYVAMLKTATVTSETMMLTPASLLVNSLPASSWPRRLSLDCLCHRGHLPTC